MNFKLGYSDNRVIRQNLPFIMGLTILCAVSLFVVLLNIQQYKNNQAQINLLDKDLAEYNKKKQLLDFKSQVLDSEIDLDTANQALTQLVPTQEDYFSVIIALEKISAQTNFIITSYNINVDSSTINKLAIEIEGQGDPNSFLEFLRNYNFAGGRLITIDKIDFNQAEFTGTKVNIYVYTGKVDQVQPVSEVSALDLDLVKNLLEKIQIEIVSENPVVFDYPTKSNPF